MQKKSLLMCLVVSVLGCADQDEPQPTELVSSQATALSAPTGIYHVADALDAVSLELAEDQTFRWVLRGCHVDAQGDGLWTTTAGGVLLLPAAGELTFFWPEAGALVEYESLLAWRGTGEQALRVAPSDDALAQVWSGGGVCTLCDASREPIGQELCEQPFE
jgi:hypothetical protein